MKKLSLRLFAIGMALSAMGLYFLIRPKTVIYCTELGQILIATLAILIALSLINLYFNIRAFRSRKNKG